MAILDVESLLEPISEESPCGPNLEYDDQFVALEAAARGKPEQQYGDTIIAAEEPDWREVCRHGLDLVHRTKDLRVVCLLARAFVETEGLPAFAESLAVIRGYLERYWQFVHPQLDPDDANDPTLRVNTIASLSSASATVKSLRTRPIIYARTVGQFSLRDIAVANGDQPPLPDQDIPTPSAIEAAFMQCELDMLKVAAAATRESLVHAELIENMVTDQVGAANAVSLDGLRETLSEIMSLYDEYLPRRDSSADAGDEPFGQDDVAAADGAPAPAARRDGEIRTREDVLNALDRVCQYYDRWEPSSPVPLLLRRAKRLASKSFLEIVKDLTPGALDQIQSLSGISDDDSDE